jgi:sarcosine oxidase
VAKHYDVAVIGAGVFGSWIARMLRRSGASVILIDQHGPGNSRSSSGGETRIIRMCYGADEIYTRAAMRSMELWKEVFESEPLFTRTGVLLTASEGDPYLTKAHETLTKCGVNHEALGYEALRETFPELAFDPGTIGIYEPDNGVILARRAVRAVASDVMAAAVSSPTMPGVLETTQRRISARTLVFACGPWLASLFPDVVGERIQPSRQEVFFFGPPPGDRGRMPVWIDFGEGAYSVPDLDGRGFKLAVDKHGPPIDPETGDRAFTPEKLAEVRAVLDRRFPGLRGAPLVESRVCQYENTWNGDFLIDRHPHFENVWLVGGGSGHGFKHGPLVGEYVASQIAGTAAPEPRFSLASKQTRRARTVY